MQITLARPTARARSLPILKISVVTLVILLSVLVAQSSTNFGWFWVFGLAFGVILQRSRLCFNSAFRDLFLIRNGKTMRAILLGVGVATLGFAVIEQKLVPNPTFGALPPQAHLMPIGLQLIVGGLLFGLGMVIAGGCVSGTMYRMGEGYVGSWVAMAGILVGLFGATQTWNWWWTNTSAGAPIIWLPSSFGYAGAIALTLLLLAVAYLLTLWWEFRSGPTPDFGLNSPPSLPAMSMRDTVARGYEKVVKRGWPILAGALALGVLNILAYQFEHPLGVTGELSQWANRGAGLLGVNAPELIGTDLLAGCLLVFENTAGLLGEGLMLDGGLIIGALLAAVLADEFKVRFPRRRVRYFQSLGGGVVMGYGAGLAAGCTIGAFFSAVPSLGLNGFVFGLALLLGAGAGVQVIRRIP